jgi:hypothetical protein
VRSFYQKEKENKKKKSVKSRKIVRFLLTYLLTYFCCTALLAPAGMTTTSLSELDDDIIRSMSIGAVFSDFVTLLFPSHLLLLICDFSFIAN